MPDVESLLSYERDKAKDCGCSIAARRWAGPGRGSITDNINNFQHNVILPSCAAMLPPPTSNTLAVFILSQHFVYYSTISARLIHSTIQIKSTH